MQSTVVMAFRKRLSKRGYKNICIKKSKENDIYIVLAKEPLAGVVVQAEYSNEKMYRSFR